MVTSSGCPFEKFYFFLRKRKEKRLDISLPHGWTCCLRKAMRVSMAMTIINCKFVMKASFFRAAQNIFFPMDSKKDLKSSCLVAERAFL